MGNINIHTIMTVVVTENIGYLVIVFISTFLNILLTCFLRGVEGSYAFILKQILYIECVYFYSRLLLPIDSYSDDEGETILNISQIVYEGLKYLLIYIPINNDTFKNLYLMINFVFRYSFEFLMQFMYYFLFIEMMLSVHNPISQVKNRSIIYNIISGLMFIIMFAVSSFMYSMKGGKYSLFYLITDSTLLFIFFVLGLISCIYLLIKFWSTKSFYKRILIIKHILYFVLYLGLFFPLKMYITYVKLIKGQKAEIDENITRILLLLHFSTCIPLFFVRLLETKIVYVCHRRYTRRHLHSMNDSGVTSSKNNMLYNHIWSNINKELIYCVLYGLSNVFSNKEEATIDQSHKQLVFDTDIEEEDYLSKGKQNKIILQKYGLSSVDFLKTKEHCVKYNISIDDFYKQKDDNLIRIVTEQSHVLPHQRLSKNFIDESLGNYNNSKDKLITHTANQMEYDASFIEYFPKVFRKIRETDGINDKMLGISLNPMNNKKSMDKLKQTKGRSGSFFFFSEDKRFIIKTITSSELEYLLFTFMIEYFKYIISNNNTLLSKIYGVFSFTINDGASTIHVIIMQNLEAFDNKYRQYVFDLKGSTFQRRTKNITKGKNSTLKDLDFTWIKRVNKQLINFSKEAKNTLLKQVKQDINMLCCNNLMDYSLLLIIYKFPENKKSESYIQLTELFKNELYKNRIFKSENQTYVYIIGIIDYLQEYNCKKFSEKSIKTCLYWNKRDKISAQKPIIYAERFAMFLNDEVLSQEL